MLDAVWLIPLFPLAGFTVLLLFGRKLGEPWAGWLATAMMVGSFVTSVIMFFALLDRPADDRLFSRHLFDWIPAGSFRVGVGFLADPLSITMCLFITGVGSLIHLYSIGYMHGDRDFSKFFVYLNLFAFSMLMLVLGDNMLLTFVGWEGVGACSYLLISFWFTSEANASAGKKAFVTNRIGDFGFMIAIFLTFSTLGTIRYVDVFGKANGLSATTASAIVALLFLGAVGKSAQFPLYVWLPDAMAGPTPVSALIHAATMVTSGVYLLTRINPLIAAGNSWVPDLIGWVGAGTALLAATIAIAQNDIKKVLAYSTISQLGYMFLAVGSGAYVAAVFHMVTHAFFKALLFLGSGSVIHGMHDDQDMRHYGNLRKWMPVTAGTFIVGWLAIAGVPPFAGFWSKDDVLANAWDTNKGLWVVGIVTAVITAFYMSRLVFMTFFGQYRGSPDVHPHESGWLMLVPLGALALLSTVGGFIEMPFADSLKRLQLWLEPSLFGHEHELQVHLGLWLLGGVSVLAALIGIGAAVMVYLRHRVEPSRVELPVFAHAWGYDEAITAFAGGPGRDAFEATAAFDREVVDGAVDEVAVVVRQGGGLLRHIQNGFVRSYAALVGVGAAALLILFLARATL